MWSEYDENINNNIFFQELIKNHYDIVVKCSEESWIICVPRQNTIEDKNIKIETIFDHILIASIYNETNSKFTTLSKKHLNVKNRQIHINNDDYKDCVNICFEETFYINNHAKYIVWCLEKPLFYSLYNDKYHLPISLTCLHDCIDFLWTEKIGYVALEKIQKLCNDCNEIENEENLQTQTEIIGNLYSKCLQIVINTKFVEKSRNEKHFNSLKLAVETYIQHCLGQKLMKAINTAVLKNDAILNKIIRNSIYLQLEHLNISHKFFNVIIKAQNELARINNSTTILDKTNCLKRTTMHLNQSKYNIITSDDLIQIFVYLIIKLNINNWLGNLFYIKQFNFSTCINENCGQTQFLIATLEAAVEFIKTAPFYNINNYLKIEHNSLFEMVQLGDFETLSNIAKMDKLTENERKLCHPLCNCEKCLNIKCYQNSTLDVVNDEGLNLLMFAILIGRCDMVEFLIEHVGFNVNNSDNSGRTALHYACLKGHQNDVLILLNTTTDPNVRDVTGNTCMHLAANNGHEGCIKALLYSHQQFDVNALNQNSETALHLATRWGYVDVVIALLEGGACPDLPNKRGMTTSLEECTNYRIERLLMTYSSITNIDINEKTTFIGDQQQQHGIRVVDDVKKKKRLKCLLKAVQNNDLRLTCYYLGFASSIAPEMGTRSKCHPLCNCPQCGEDTVEAAGGGGVAVGVNWCDEDGLTALHVAAKWNRAEIVRVLLDSNALPNLQTYETLYTPLHLASHNQCLGAVRELVASGGCLIDARDFRGNTPLYYACLKNDVKIADVLIASGADSASRNLEGKTVIGMVEEKMLYKVFMLLRKHTQSFDVDDIF